jgi:hypothetical protein
VQATLALGKVLSTPAGVTIFELLRDARDDVKHFSIEYNAMIAAKKRPSVAREKAARMVAGAMEEERTLKDCLTYILIDAGEHKFGKLAALHAINYELEASEGMPYRGIVEGCFSLVMPYD